MQHNDRRSTDRPAADGFIPRRGRPTQVQIAVIEHTILSTARRLFLHHGYADTAMEAVATSAGVSKGTLYARYPSKADLFAAIAAERIRAWADLIDEDATPHGTEIDTELLGAGIRFLRELRHPQASALDRLIQRESSRFPDLAQQFFERSYRSVVDRLTEAIAFACSAPGQRAEDAQGVATAFYAALSGWFRSETLSRDVTPEDCARYAARLTSIFIAGRSAW